MACSALKEKYRATLAAGMPASAVKFVWLDGPRNLIEERLAERSHEFMDPKLLESQFETLEPPKDALRIVNDRSPQEIVEQILAHASPERVW
jgi:gluconokinase